MGGGDSRQKDWCNPKQKDRKTQYILHHQNVLSGRYTTQKKVRVDKLKGQVSQGLVGPTGDFI